MSSNRPSRFARAVSIVGEPALEVEGDIDLELLREIDPAASPSERALAIGVLFLRRVLTLRLPALRPMGRRLYSLRN